MSDKFSGGVKPGSTSVSIPILLRKTSDGTEQTGITSASVTASYWRQGGVRVSIPVHDLVGVGDVYSSGGWKEVDAVNQPGIYRLDVPDAAIATGVEWSIVSVKVTSCFVYHERFNLETARAEKTVADAVKIKTDQLVFTTPNRVDASAFVDPVSLNPITSLIYWLMKAQIFSYIGSASNVFSKVDGSFVGKIHFYRRAFADFIADPISAPVPGDLLATLNSDGTMSDTAGLVNNGDVLLFTLESFNALSDVSLNLFVNYNKGNIRAYIPTGAITVNVGYPYYPMTDGGLLVSNGTNLVNFAETAYGKSLALIPNIDWDRISQPIVCSTTVID